MSLEKMHSSVKEQFCEYVYEKYIVVAADVLKRYEEYACTINAKMPVSCYTNFRDALFHFRKMVSVVEQSEIERQAFAVKEHLSRAMTDGGNSILYHLSRVAETILQDDSIPGEVNNQIRVKLHSLKTAILRKRFSGMMISDDEFLSISHEEIQDMIDNFYSVVEESCASSFARYSIGLCDDLEKESEKIM